MDFLRGPSFDPKKPLMLVLEKVELKGCIYTIKFEVPSPFPPLGSDLTPCWHSHLAPFSPSNFPSFFENFPIPRNLKIVIFFRLVLRLPNLSVLQFINPLYGSSSWVLELG